MKYRNKNWDNPQWIMHRMRRHDKPRFETMSERECIGFISRFVARSRRNNGAAKSFSALREEFIRGVMTEVVRAAEERAGWWDW